MTIEQALETIAHLADEQITIIVEAAIADGQIVDAADRALAVRKLESHKAVAIQQLEIQLRARDASVAVPDFSALMDDCESTAMH
jgi:hypothetical protein